MRILITGSNGLLGQKIVCQLLNAKEVFLATSLGVNRNDACPSDHYCVMDITNQADIERVLKDFQPSHVIHTAAMTNVDACELDPPSCESINVDAVRHLAHACQKNGVHFQMLSTDFVFDGEKGNYSEEDKPNPLSVYAKSKVQGEKIVSSLANLSYSIVRTIIVYGTGQNLSRSNIVLWAKEALQKGQELTIIDDQFRAPTWADDLAWACIRICRLNEQGIFHIAGPETMSIFALVERIAMHYHLPMSQVKRTDSSTLNQPAVRPPKTGFDLSKAKNRLGYRPKTLEETLDLL
jgi:dTDP-4-dehydrorhamnose reductase